MNSVRHRSAAPECCIRMRPELPYLTLLTTILGRMKNEDNDQLILLSHQLKSPINSIQTMPATGAQSFVPKIRGIEQEGIYSLRNIEDAENSLAASPTIKRDVQRRAKPTTDNDPLKSC